MSVVQTSRHGVSLKAAHYDEWLAGPPQTAWVEAVTENFLGRGGRPAAVLERVRSDAQVALHGVSMSLGGLDPLDGPYFTELRRLAERNQVAIVSDHLCFGTVDGHHGHDLWPLPRTGEALRHAARRIRMAQDMLGMQIAVENVSSYLEYRDSDMGEADFIASVVEEANAGMLLDVNNVYVSAHNLGFDARAYIDRLPAERVRYYHLAGHADMGTHLLDNHGSAVCDGVWDLYEYTVQRVGQRPTIVEWDCHLPSLERLVSESRTAARREASALSVSAA